MWNSVISSVSSVVSRVWQWFDRLFDALPGAWEFFMVAIIIYLIFKHVLMPLVGGALRGGSSDKVKKGSGKKE